jgi:hypothetical protein
MLVNVNFQTHFACFNSAGCSLQSLVVASPAKSELHEIDPQEKSPKGEKKCFDFVVCFADHSCFFLPLY